MLFVRFPCPCIFRQLIMMHLGVCLTSFGQKKYFEFQILFFYLNILSYVKRSLKIDPEMTNLCF